MVPEVKRHKFMEHKGLSIDGDKGGGIYEKENVINRIIGDAGVRM